MMEVSYKHVTGLHTLLVISNLLVLFECQVASADFRKNKSCILLAENSLIHLLSQVYLLLLTFLVIQEKRKLSISQIEAKLKYSALNFPMSKRIN